MTARSSTPANIRLPTSAASHQVVRGARAALFLGAKGTSSSSFLPWVPPEEPPSHPNLLQGPHLLPTLFSLKGGALRPPGEGPYLSREGTRGRRQGHPRGRPKAQGFYGPFPGGGRDNGRSEREPGATVMDRATDYLYLDDLRVGQPLCQRHLCDRRDADHGVCSRIRSATFPSRRRRREGHSVCRPGGKRMAHRSAHDGVLVEA